MALSGLMRTALRSCQVRPAFLLTTKYSSPAALSSFSHIHKALLLPKPCCVGVSGLKEFSTSPVRSSGDHAKLWTVERVVAGGLLGVIPVGLAFPNIVTDLLMAVSLVMHMHWGIEANAIDYIRPIIFGKVIPKIAVGLVYAVSIFTLIGLLNLTFNNAGLAHSIKLLWSLN